MLYIVKLGETNVRTITPNYMSELLHTYHIVMNSFHLLYSVVVVQRKINYLIFNVLIQYLVSILSSVLLLKSGTIFLLNFVYLLLIVYSVL